MGSTIRVTAVETDGDTQSHLWPDRFVFSVTVPYALPILAQLRAYLSHRSPSIPLTTFIPDRIRDSDQSAANQSHFRSLSRMLWDGQLVAIVRIALSSPSSSPGDAERHGILLFPTSNSSSVLFGALFLTPADVFPDFVYTQRATHTAAPSFASTYPNSPKEAIGPSLLGHFMGNLRTLTAQFLLLMPIHSTVMQVLRPKIDRRIWHLKTTLITLDIIRNPPLIPTTILLSAVLQQTILDMGGFGFHRPMTESVYTPLRF
ncbi:hypothetical protein BDP27DRAFT_1364501 [Rhodocollybia butyracea]|uniref:Uncharacterized protein n=1 Tax=Rhodocollybia butyracea TaxID=206335 RepID=A0A9P5U6N3_9AGAR|nr:hypothetical protein BDP27DRAFT_1364501 [Rhodocollybia butyracea]